MECLATHQGRGQQVRDPTRRLHRSDPGPPGHPHAPLRASAVQDLLRRPQLLRARRLQRQDLDLPLLLPAQPFPAALLLDLRDQPPRRALPAVHHRPVRASRRFLAAIAAVAGLRVRARHLHDRGGDGVCQIGPQKGNWVVAR